MIENYSYSLQDVIGQGFSSVVYKGLNETTREDVAIKVVEQRSLQEAVQQMVLTNEIQNLKRLRSDNILKLYDVFQTYNNTYIITEFCDQGDLGTYIKKNGKLKEEYAVRTLKHIVNGLKELAKQGIAHRDLKPANILIKSGIPKIADFGFAKSLKQIQENAKYEFNVGTPLYMSPETLTQNEYSTKTDIWSLGILFYELLFGHIPWQVSTEEQLLDKIFHCPVVFPFAVSPESQDIIKRALIINPQQRISLQELICHPLLKTRVQQQVRKSPSQMQQLSVPHQHKNLSVGTQVEESKQIQVIRTQIDYCKYLYMVFGRLKNYFQTPFLVEKLRFLIAKNLMIKCKKLEEQFWKKNVFKLSEMVMGTSVYREWREEFRERAEKYGAVFRETWEGLSGNEEFLKELVFDEEFDALFDANHFEQPSFYMILEQQLKGAIKELNHLVAQRITSESVPDELKECLVGLDSLISLVNITNLLKRSLFDFYRFSEEAAVIDQLMEPSKAVEYMSFLEMRQKVKSLLN